MWQVIILAVIQSALLAGGQVFLKFALARMETFGWNRAFWLSVFTNWQFAMCGLCFASCSILWMYIVKHYPLSVAYPMISLSYVFGMIAAIIFFHETVALYKWVGVALIISGCCLIASPASAQTNDAAVRQKINAATSQLKSMQCDFVQTKSMKLLNDKMIAKGQMYYSQGSKLRWEYVSPYTYTFILNGSRVMLNKGDRNDVIDVNQSKVFKEVARIMMNSVTGRCLADEKDFKSTITTTRTEWIVAMVPQDKNLKQLFTKMVLHFDPRSCMVSVVELIEKNGDTTVIELRNVRTNTPIDAKMFAID